MSQKQAVVGLASRNSNDLNLFVIHYFSIFANLKSDVVYGMHIFGFIKPVDFRLKIFHNTFPGSGLYPRH